MPLSKQGKKYYTPEQFEHARYSTSALSYAESHGYPLVKKGNYFVHQDHDSMVFTQNGQWYWNSQNLKGGALELLMYYENQTFVDAVLTLSNELEHVNQSHKDYTKKTVVPKAAFSLPPKSDNFKRLFAYLVSSRGLDKEIVTDLVSNKKIYESENTHNVVFVGYDDTGKPASGFRRGTLTNKPFKGDVTGSNKRIGWLMEATSPTDTVMVFEACIDAISHATIGKLHENHYMENDRLVLGGTADNALRQYLKTHPHIKNVVMSLDNDEAGSKATKNIATKLKKQDYKMFKATPTGKDWNEDLLEMRKVLALDPPSSEQELDF